MKLALNQFALLLTYQTSERILRTLQLPKNLRGTELNSALGTS